MYPNTRDTGSRQAEIIAQTNDEHKWPGQEELATNTAKVRYPPFSVTFSSPVGSSDLIAIVPHQRLTS